MAHKGIRSLLCGLAAALGLSGSTLATDCPPPGSGLQGVLDWQAQYCPTGTPNCGGTPATCNIHFGINLISVTTLGDLVTYEWRICQFGGPAALSHWIFDTTGLTCVSPEFTLDDLIVEVTFNGIVLDPDFYDIGLDPTTQIDGFKFDIGGPQGQCATYTVTFDTSKLLDGYTLGVGCVMGATKAGNEDIRRADRPSPGYQCVEGPICIPAEPECWEEETAWAFGPRYTRRGNWATYTPYVAGSTVTVFAGQHFDAGTAHFSAINAGFVTVTITLNHGFRFADVGHNVKIQDYAMPPSGNPAPGRFAHKAAAAGSPFAIVVPANNYYGVHLDVERGVDCE